MTYRERRERRAERLREWAAKRELRSAAAFEQAHQISDMIPFGQPVLVGHHSQRRHERDLGRIDAAMGRGVEHQRKATKFVSRADNIEAAMEAAIYSDDPDAIEALERRIAGLEAERDRIKAYNASCRRGAPDESLLDEAQRDKLARVHKYAAFQLGKSGAFPAYALSNLNGNIKRNRDRLAILRGET